MLSFPGEGRGLGQQSSHHSCFVLFQFFSVFVNFLSVFLKLSCGCDVFIFIVGFFFRSLLVNIGKNICMFFRRQSFCLLLLDFRVRFSKITAKTLMRCS